KLICHRGEVLGSIPARRSLDHWFLTGNLPQKWDAAAFFAVYKLLRLSSCRTCPSCTIRHPRLRLGQSHEPVIEDPKKRLCFSNMAIAVQRKQGKGAGHCLR